MHPFGLPPFAPHPFPYVGAVPGAFQGCFLSFVSSMLLQALQSVSYISSGRVGSPGMYV